VAPVELVGLARRKTQRHIGRRRPVSMRPAPPFGVAPHRIVAAVIAAPPQFLKDPDQRQLLAGGLFGIAGQQGVEFFRPPPELRARLDIALVFKGGLARPQDFADRVPGHLQVPRNLSDRLALDEVLTPNSRNRLHDQHPPPPAYKKGRAASTADISKGSILDADPPTQGVKIARRITRWTISRLTP
jgi:hypothetical protein